MISNLQLEKYAKLLVWFGLNAGKWPNIWQTICVTISETASFFLPHLVKTIYEYQCYPLIQYMPSDLGYLMCMYSPIGMIDKIFHKKTQWIIEESDHWIDIISPTIFSNIKWIDNKILWLYEISDSHFMMKMLEKERLWKLSRTEWIIATNNIAEIAWMTIDDYRNQIIKACFLDDIDPISKNKTIVNEIEKYRDKLNMLEIDYIYMKWEDCDINIKIGQKRKWLTWSYKNIPSFEIFTSPDFRWTNGRIRFTQPLYVSGKKISDIFLVFKNGVVVEYDSSENKDLLRSLLETKWWSMIWEFSMTDARFSSIHKSMAVTLYDENIWWLYGNSHIAIGNSYLDTFDWNINKFNIEDLGFNKSDIHYDLVMTKPRTIFATTKLWEKLCIYNDGRFII